ncbi:hypothetical protein EF847_21430 [Actinobacteria bacterium YIM 96077]|uniref:Uncharacterized protein n=1 Tax=Phytoactinopolyspora halophila TaxID=1981511 RepID=A0A329QSM4_9ACTN|nr:hypothetical protein [Phytoactinopolyspora halophila]AYY14866.1 hypothetical protein EF847_21430 [Actinobacteria bacterium YIM 96077]RAW15325.1 hypothetical protein DPM12_08660 [Phytoactinopolyspora halophila]
MGYSGLIYAAIVAAWLAVLVPRWVRRNEEVERARETDVANGVRVLNQPSKSRHAPHRPRADATGESGVTGSDEEGHNDQMPAPANARRGRSKRPLTRDELALRRLSDSFNRAAMRRRRMLFLVMLTTVVVVAGTYAGQLPGWAPALSIGALVGFLALARRAAVEQQRRLAVLRRRIARQRARDAASEQASEGSAADEETGKRIAVLDPPEPQAPAEDTWEPVKVPLPTYMTKPKAPRATRTIDLSQPGSWTSGRLEPGKSFDLPSHTANGSASAQQARESEAGAEETPEKRRAVGE